MDSQNRQKIFMSAVQKKVGGDSEEWKTSGLFGTSNKASIIEGGLQVGVSNPDSWKTTPKGMIFAAMLRFPPADEIYFAVIIESASYRFMQRLQLMIEIGQRQKQKQKEEKENKGRIKTKLKAEENEEEEKQEEEVDSESSSNAVASEIKYSDRNNNVVICLAADDGKIYLRNKQFWNNLAIDRSSFGPAIDVDQILFAVYPPEPSAKRNLLVRDFVGYFVSLVGRDKVEEIQPWESEISLSPEMRRMPGTIPFAEILAGVHKLGGYFANDLVERYHVALNHLNHKHFVILSGLSGTGKTSLAKFYAFAVHGLINTDVDDPFFFMCVVRPDWTDPTGLIGYHDIISGKYTVTPFLQAILIATAHKDTPIFVCIDEMNIARSEFYFADILSAMESEMPLHIHSNSVPLDGSSGEQVPSEIKLPSNLFIVGTINIDESTQPLSDKILDRANSIDMSFVDIKGFLEVLALRYTELTTAIDGCSRLLIQLSSTLSPYSLGFGYRVVEEFVRYYAFVERTGVMEKAKALDSQIAQKVLVKLRGGESQRDLLEKLTRILQSYPHSLKIVEGLKRQLEEYGSFQYLR